MNARAAVAAHWNYPVSPEESDLGEKKQANRFLLSVASWFDATKVRVWPIALTWKWNVWKKRLTGTGQWIGRVRPVQLAVDGNCWNFSGEITQWRAGGWMTRGVSPTETKARFGCRVCVCLVAERKVRSSSWLLLCRVRFHWLSRAFQSLASRVGVRFCCCSCCTRLLLDPATHQRRRRCALTLFWSLRYLLLSIVFNCAN